MCTPHRLKCQMLRREPRLSPPKVNGESENLKMKTLAQVAADHAKDEYRHDVLTRKMTFVEGQGPSTGTNTTSAAGELASNVFDCLLNLKIVWILQPT